MNLEQTNVESFLSSLFSSSENKNNTDINSSQGFITKNKKIIIGGIAAIVIIIIIIFIYKKSNEPFMYDQEEDIVKEDFVKEKVVAPISTHSTSSVIDTSKLLKLEQELTYNYTQFLEVKYEELNVMKIWLDSLENILKNLILEIDYILSSHPNLSADIKEKLDKGKKDAFFIVKQANDKYNSINNNGGENTNRGEDLDSNQNQNHLEMEPEHHVVKNMQFLGFGNKIK